MKIFGFSFLRRLAPHYGPHYGVAAQGVLRGLGLIYVISFWSLAAQLIALSGANGLIPTNALLEFYQEQTGGWGPLWFPSLVWIYDNPLMLLGITGLGAITGITMLYGFFPWISAFISWICWVSLLQVCQPWMSTPGDYLMAEVGLWSLLLISPKARSYPSPSAMGSRITGILLLNGVLVKVLFSSGMAKLTFGSASWAEATAFFHFFESQALPTTAAWYAHHLPEVILKYGVWGMMFVELILPFYVFLPRTFRNILAGAVSLQTLLLLLTGHHGFLPLLLFVLAFALLDDVTWRKILPESWGPPAAISIYKPKILSYFLLVTVLPLLIWQVFLTKPEAVMPPWKQAEGLLGRVHASNRYALLNQVAEHRQEFSIQGSIDGRTWVEYRFRLKPTDPKSLPRISVLHLPRLDHQFTKFAMELDTENPEPTPIWLVRLMGKLLQNDATTLSLFPVNPFPTDAPQFIRLAVYDYRFADPVTRREEKIWWIREFKGFYGPVFTREKIPQMMPAMPQALGEGAP